jgi:hypothetical protein
MSKDLMQFVESRVGFLEHCLDVWKASEDRHQRASAKYSFKQAFFYAAVNYMEWRPFISEGAIAEATERGFVEQLPIARWDDQPRFDAGREVFHFEHVFTGEMCWRAIEKMHGRIDSGSLEALLRENYAVAWILKEEDGRLPRSTRGTTLHDALAMYAERGVKLVRDGQHASERKADLGATPS